MSTRARAVPAPSGMGCVESRYVGALDRVCAQNTHLYAAHHAPNVHASYGLVLAYAQRMASTQAQKKSGGAKATIDHDVIKEWAESRGGKPATVKGTDRAGDDVGIIRIDFPGYSGEGKLQDISWDSFFEKFDEAGLAMLFQEETAHGEVSRFNKFVKRDSVDERTEIVEASAEEDEEADDDDETDDEEATDEDEELSTAGNAGPQKTSARKSSSTQAQKSKSASKASATQERPRGR